MKREVNMADISDGKLYGINDMVKADCGGCVGCSACCRGMGQSIILDPLDIYNLTTNLSVSFEELLDKEIELNVFDGIILPNVKMNAEDACSFLNDEGRCEIHTFRPGVCRLFPLGRFYEADGFRYFLQTKECKKDSRSKIKVKNWIGIENIKENEKFINEWHDFIKELQEKFIGQDESTIKKIDMFILQHFYIEKYNQVEDFCVQFDARLKKAIEVIKLLLP